jgi:hypothetical protein
VVLLKVVGGKSKIQEVFEAEYAWINNFNLTQDGEVISGQGRIIVDSKCSGHAKVGWLGHHADNYIEFRDIYAAVTGSYYLTISYISVEKQNATLSINKIDTLLTDLNSEGFTPTHCTVPVKLNKGFNTIRFSNATGWMPDFDKIQLDLNK